MGRGTKAPEQCFTPLPVTREDCYQIATKPGLRGGLILALEPNPTMGDTGLEPVTSALSRLQEKPC
jgi:hypothetical protein